MRLCYGWLTVFHVNECIKKDCVLVDRLCTGDWVC